MSDSAPEPAELHFHRDDPKLMGETIVMGAQMTFGSPRVATYECQGQWFRYVAGGTPFKTELRVMVPDGEKTMFILEKHSDGLMFHFEPERDFVGTAQVVLHAMKEQARRMLNHI